MAFRVRVQYPQNRFENLARRNRLAPQTSVSNPLFWKVVPDAFPLPVLVKTLPEPHVS
jgi:hypothetical protein